MFLRTIAKEYYQLVKVNEIQHYNTKMESDQDSGDKLLNVLKGKISNLFKYLYEMNNEDNTQNITNSSLISGLPQLSLEDHDHLSFDDKARLVKVLN